MLKTAAVLLLASFIFQDRALANPDFFSAPAQPLTLAPISEKNGSGLRSVQKLHLMTLMVHRMPGMAARLARDCGPFNREVRAGRWMAGKIKAEGGRGGAGDAVKERFDPLNERHLSSSAFDHPTAVKPLGARMSGDEAGQAKEERSLEKISGKLNGLLNTIAAVDNAVFTVSRRI